MYLKESNGYNRNNRSFILKHYIASHLLTIKISYRLVNMKNNNLIVPIILELQNKFAIAW